MPSPVEYQQVGGSAVYEIPAGNQVAGWSGYVLKGSSLPPAIGFKAAFDNQGGSYLFASARPAALDSDPKKFAEDALRYFAVNAPNVRGAAWLASSAPTVFGAFGEFGFAFMWDPIQKLYQLTSNLNVSLGSTLNFFVLRNLYIRADEAAATLVLAIRRGTQEFIGFQRGQRPVGIVVSPGVQQEARIPVTGANAGGFLFTAEITPAIAFAASMLPVGCTYAVRATQGGGADTRLDYPIFGKLPDKLATIGVVDPSDPYNRTLGAAALAAGALRTAFGLSPSVALASQFRTAQGHALDLLPLGSDPAVTALPLAAGALALASASPVDTLTRNCVAYLAPAGSYGVVAGGTDGKEDLLCGLFGSERLSFLPAVGGATNGNPMRWLPSQPGYAPVYPFATVDLDNPSSGCVKPRLDPRYLTSWMTLGGTPQAQYHAEPEGAPLYGKPTAEGLLNATPPSAEVSGDPAHSFPLVPYAGVSTGAGVTADLITGMESEIIAPTRRTLINEGATPTWQLRAAALRVDAAKTDTSTTPQGLLVTIDPASGAYQEVLLAQSERDDGSLLPFAFEQPTIEVQQALQTNQLFVVAVNPDPFVRPPAAFANVADIAGWTMTANVGRGATPTSYKNVMIMKYCAGSLAERVTNPNRWTDPEVFSLLPEANFSVSGRAPSTARSLGSVRAGGSCRENDALAYTGLSQWLQDYIAAAIALADGNSSAAPFYQRFKQIVTDPNWNGVIVLAADLAPGDLPPQIQGLAAGIDLSRFNSHHFGFNASRVKVKDKQLSLEGPSSWFGLVDYSNLAYEQGVLAGASPELPVPFTVSADFGFTVLQLRSLFENSALTRFESRIQLTCRRLFSSRVTAAFRNGEGLPETAVVLTGSYIAQGDSGAYVFEQTTPSIFATDSNVLSAVAFNRVQFNTLGPRDGGATVASRFLIWGMFDFVQLDAADGSLLDVLSFGSAPGTPPPQLGRGLAFSNLSIDMSFPAVTPNAVSFVLNTANLAYDTTASQARDDSLYRGFSLQLKSFVQVTDAQTPAQLGFLPVSSPLVLERLAEPWYGVVYEVTLGGPGALASNAGFSSNMLIAWSPKSTAGSGTRSLFIGLSLPGAAPGARLFSVQGVFKIAVGAIALSRQEVPDTGQQPPPPPRHYYCLSLNDIALKIFGIAKLPPSATIRFFLFGDPGRPGSLGWYAAYVADDLKAAPALPPAPSAALISAGEERP
ncbi:hypothetical protein KK141_09820 [Dyella sp. LX-66]|uniref:hypothetical protein n=1 Tax=unclassified Dyella TaxID=2634549 RepID=UPI001BDF80C8|nr:MULTISPECIES: hypothetical protein [unclassified Dyella]MBT2117096.1 hypothetical protein [Dyella sp. LX-1]MBT2139828.1 hypothetical protein [Dyella sp. LX-66]